VRILAVTNLYPGPGHPALGTFIEQQIKGLRAIGLDVETMIVDRSNGGYGSYIGLGGKVRAKVAGCTYDLVHAMYGGVMGHCVVRALINVPGVVSFCGSDLLGENLPGLFRRLAVAYGVCSSRRAARLASGIVVKSENLRRALPGRTDPSKVRVIPNGVDLARFRPMDRRDCCSRLGWNPSQRHVLFPANAGSPCKRLWLAESSLKTAEARGCHFQLHPLEGVSHQDVPIWLNACDVVLLTSEREGSPNIVKEALACNTPIVSVDVGDVAERLRGVDGCFVARTDAEALATSLVTIHHEFRRLSNGRETVRRLSLEAVARRLEVFYGEILAPRRTEDCCAVTG
jgi:teichuronic acid biosynthesis glycosyltransferase TuaC